MNLFFAWFVTLIVVAIWAAKIVIPRLDAKAMRRWRRDEERRRGVLHAKPDHDTLGEEFGSDDNEATSMQVRKG